jgi:hypothetical protein
MNSKVDFYFIKANLPAGKAGKWQEELKKLRAFFYFGRKIGYVLVF